eukprot:3934094-Rhodomonas_salina.3
MRSRCLSHLAAFALTDHLVIGDLLCLGCPRGSSCPGHDAVNPTEGFWRGENMLCPNLACDSLGVCNPVFCETHPGTPREPGQRPNVSFQTTLAIAKTAHSGKFSSDIQIHALTPLVTPQVGRTVMSGGSELSYFLAAQDIAWARWWAIWTAGRGGGKKTATAQPRPRHSSTPAAKATSVGPAERVMSAGPWRARRVDTADPPERAAGFSLDRSSCSRSLSCSSPTSEHGALWSRKTRSGCSGCVFRAPMTMIPRRCLGGNGSRRRWEKERSPTG